MAQIAKQSDKFDFVVESAPSFMQLPSGSFVPDGFSVNRRMDTMQVLGKVSDRYGIVQNTDLLSVAEDAFKAKGMADYKRTIITTGEGERMFATYDFCNRVKKLKRGDEIGMRLTVQNSFDGSLRASFSLGMLRLICTNGMVSVEREVSMTKKHSMGIDTKFILKALDKAVVSWDNSADALNRLADASLTQEQGVNILAQLEDSAVLSGKLRENIGMIWASPRHVEDSERNLFNLYNSVTQHLTHDVSATRFELANRVSGNVLSVLDRAARNPSRLAELIQPVAVPLEVVSLN